MSPLLLWAWASAGLEPQRPLHRPVGGLALVGFVQGRGEIAPARCEIAVQFKRALVGLDGLLRAAHLPQDVAEIVVHDRVVGVQTNGFAEVLHGLFGLALVLVGERDIRVRFRVVGLQFQRLGDEKHGLVRPEGVDTQHAEQVEGVDVVPVLFQNRQVQPFRFIEAAGLVLPVPGLEHVLDVLVHCGIDRGSALKKKASHKARL